MSFGLLVGSLLAAAGCGSSQESAKDPVQAQPAAARSDLATAQSVDISKFPKPRAGQSIEDFAAQFDGSGPQAIAATSIFRPPRDRIAFGLLDASQKLAYGPTVVYVQRRGAAGGVLGPIAAPADALITEPRYRSQQAATDKDAFAAIYEAEAPLAQPGIYQVLAVSDVAGRRIGAAMAVQVKSRAEDRIPDVGEQAPRVQTDTRSTVKGDVSLLDTRLPPAPELATKSFTDVVTKKPVALLFSTPQLCQSRVCGPVTDEMLQLKARYGDKMTFIHQEVYVDNKVDEGLRPSLQRFGLHSEPWLFTVRKDGTIAARLEGAFGLRAFEDAVKAAL
ncbi:MAG: hypothetical protein ACR2NB_02655 [Solirubrobacteraceae bacterium]